jgi:hypothetical protein
MDVLTAFLNKISYKFPKGYPDMNNEQDIFIVEQELHKLNINLQEVKLSVRDLEKPFPPRHEFEGKYANRGERFLEKIINNEPIVLANGEQVIIDKAKSKEAIEALKSKNYSVFEKGAKLFKDKDDNSYSISSFEKTSEFGSGSGQGGGTVNTAIQESSQSVVNTIAYSVKKSTITIEDLNNKNITEAYALSKVSVSLDDVIDFIINQKTWADSFVGTANILFSTYKNNNFEQHRGSEFVNKIYEAFKQAKKTANISIQSDKWNPADIWMVDKSILNIEFPIVLDELNAELLTLFTDEKLIGVSLKKTSASPSLKIFNQDQIQREQFSYEGFESKSTNNSSHIKYSDGIITFRTFNYATNFAGEIKGKKAMQGKIGQGSINDILKKYSEIPLPQPIEVLTSFKNQESNIIKSFTKYYSYVVENISLETMTQLIENKDLNYLVSKYLSTMLTYILDNSSKNNDIITDIINYASSNIEYSSVYVKIS